MANKVLGMHRLKNKVNRNAFDLSHRHMFTAQVGELLPVFTQWVNPNETFKIGYNGKTRTAALNTDAFTRNRRNILSGVTLSHIINLLLKVLPKRLKRNKIILNIFTDTSKRISVKSSSTGFTIITNLKRLIRINPLSKNW